MNIKRYQIFVPDKEKDKPDGKLRFRIKWSDNTVAFNVGFRIDPDKWSTDTQRCKNNTTHGKKKISAAIINKEINRYEDIANAIFNNFEKEDRIPTGDEFRVEFNKAIGKVEEEKSGFFDRYDEFVSTMSFQNSWAKGTLKKFATLKNHLTSFDSNFSFANLSEDKLNLFIRYLLDIEHKNSSIVKTISFVRWYLRWASNKGYYKGNLHNIFKPHLKGADGSHKEVIHLTWDELMCVYCFEFPKEKQYLSRVRDVFCFCCFTGLRYSDAEKLKKSDIKDDYISVVTQKTSDALKIDLNKYSKAILLKYKSIDLPKDAALPVISNQKMNKYLKELGEVCKLNEHQKIVYFKSNIRYEETYPKWELLTTHCGRRTFVVNALYLGIPAEVVMKWTGHSDYKAMKPYVKIVDDLKKSEMNKFNLK